MSDIYVKRNFLAGLETSVAPSSAFDVANKTYVDNAVAGSLSIYDSVRAESDANIDLTTGGLLTVDGVTLLDGDRVLVTGQTNPVENGIYVAAAGAWSRATDMADASEVKAFSHVFVREGSTYGGHEMVLSSTNTSETVGTDALNWIHSYTIDNDASHIDVDNSSFNTLTGANVQAVFASADSNFGTIANHVDALTGVSADNLGTFTGGTISDNTDIKTALQELETGLEGIDVTSQVSTYYAGQKYTESGITLGAQAWTTITHNLNESYPSAIAIYGAGGDLMTYAFNVEVLDANSLRIQNEHTADSTGMTVTVRV